MRAFLHSFYAKLAFALLASFLVIAVGLLTLSRSISRDYQDEVRQKLHLDLAEQIAADGDLIQNGKVNQPMLEQAFYNLMVLGPDFEFYLLDRDGGIVVYSAEPGKVKESRVHLRPILDLISGNAMLPVRGDDPRNPGRAKIFSAARFEDDAGAPWYLYVIIGGEIYDDITGLLSKSHILQLGFLIAAGGLAFCLIAILMIALLLTRPLRQLSRDIEEFRARGLSGGALTQSRWDENSEDELQRIGVAFREMARNLEAQYSKVKTTDEVRRELLSYISHDLRTPLAALQGYLETWEMKREALSAEESARIIRVALDNARRTSALVEQLFELAHLDSSDVSLDAEPVVVAELAQDVLQRFQLQADERGVALDVAPKDGSLVAMADIAKLERVLANLVENGIRHCDRDDRIDIRISAPVRERIGIEVADTGSGIAPADLPYIFDAQYRGRDPASQDGGNRGLGLAIAKRLLELHGSTIEVESNPEEGTRFWFSLPRDGNGSM